MERVDVTVIGGGPAGSAAAIALSAAGRSVRAAGAFALRPCPGRGDPAARREAAAVRARGVGPVPRQRIYAVSRHRLGVGAAGAVRQRLHRQPLRPWMACRPLPLRPDAGRGRPGSRRHAAHRRSAPPAAAAPSAGWRTDGPCGRPTAAACNSDFVIDATGRPSWFARRLGQRRTWSYDRLVAVVGL